MAVEPMTVEHGEALADLLRADRGFLTMWEPDEPDEHFTTEGQRAFIASVQRKCAGGGMRAWVITDGEDVVGRIFLTGIVLGPLRSCSTGYWVARRHAGRGFATAALRSVLDVAFGELHLHRVDAFARVDNERSCRVLEKNGFHRVGVSRGHLHVGGRWRDDAIFQKLAPWDDGIRLRPDPVDARDGR